MAFKQVTIFLCIVEILLVSGCASNAIIMTPPIKVSTVPEMNSTLYRVDKVTVPLAPPLLCKKLKGKAFAAQLTDLAEARYPGLFKNTPEAIPLHVQMEISEEIHQAASFACYMCTLCIVGGILPSVPWTTEWQIKVGIEDRSVVRTIANVQAVHRGWWSMVTPCGLITIPGESDIPAVSTVMTGGPGQVPPKLQEYVFQRVVDILAAELLRGSPLQSQEKLESLTPQQLPASIPIPSETVQPF